MTDAVLFYKGKMVGSSIGSDLQVTTMPTAASTNVGQIVQYVGATSGGYTNGYFYKCVNNSGTYSWEQVDVQPEGSSEQIQYSTVPTASASNVGQIIQYTGTTDQNYTNGYFYKCVNDGGVYSWALEKTQPGEAQVNTDWNSTSGVSELLNKPTLGTAAAKDSTNAVTQDSTDLIESGAVYTALADKANTADLGTAAAKDSTNAVTANSTDLVESGAVKSAIDAAVSSAYRAAGDKTVSQLTSALLIADNKGCVYNITDSGETTADFVGGAGKPINIGDNVAVVDVGTAGSPSYKFDLMAGFVDLTNYKTTFVGTLQQWNNLTASEKEQYVVVNITDDDYPDLGILAEAFSTSEDYVIGDYVTYLGEFYRFIHNHSAGSWVASDATSVTVGDELKRLSGSDKSITAPYETSPATAAHENGTYIYYDGAVYLVTATISVGDTLSDTGAGKNIEEAVLPEGTEVFYDDGQNPVTIDLAGKANKVSPCTNGHLAGLNSNGDLTDSGVASADVVTKVSGGTTNNLVKLDSNGKIADAGILATDVVTKVTGGTTDDLVKLDSNGKIADAGKKVSDLAEKDDISSLIETGATASQAISSGTYFYLNGALVRAKTAIASGATFTENTNYESVTVGGELVTLNTNLSGIKYSAPFTVSLDLSTAGDQSVDFASLVPSTPSGYTRVGFIGDCVTYRAYIKGFGSTVLYYTVVTTSATATNVILRAVYFKS